MMKASTKIGDIEVIESSGNVFADLGLDHFISNLMIFCPDWNEAPTIKGE
ncbi:MAG: hypothetical protein ACE5HI_18315 [bacterium]